MEYSEISKYLATGALDRPDPELDVYRHLKIGMAACKAVEPVITSYIGATDNLDHLPAVTLVDGPIMTLDELDPPIFADEAQNLTLTEIALIKTRIVTPDTGSLPATFKEKMTVAVTEAIKEVGLDQFKKTSLFGSNDKMVLPAGTAKWLRSK